MLDFQKLDSSMELTMPEGLQPGPPELLEIALLDSMLLELHFEPHYH